MLFKISYRQPDLDEQVKNKGKIRCSRCGTMQELFRYRKGFGYRCGSVVYSVVQLRDKLIKVESETIDAAPLEEALF